MTNGETADYILENYQTNKSRNFWIDFYNQYFSENSNLDNFWNLVKEAQK